MLSELIVKIFIKDSKSPEKPEVRLAYGVLAGWGGVIVNIILFSVKFAVGMLSGSIAIAADAVNNLSDCGSGAITLLGFKMGAKPPDNEHPFGHGRLEYVAALIVAVIIVAVGFNFLKESVMRIFNPSEVKADNLMLAIIGGTLLFKLWLFFFYRLIAKKIESTAVKAAAFDSLSDILATSVVVGAVFANRFTTFPIDGCAGTLVALIVIAGGIKIIRDAINPLLGQCPDKELVEKLRAKLISCKGICGIHDIIIHNYGPEQYFATAHAEVDRNGDLLRVHDTLEAAEVEVAKSMPVRLILHCDPYDIEDPEVKMWRARTEDAVNKFDHKFKLYDFRLTKENGKNVLHFHLLTPRNYALSYHEIQTILTNAMSVYGKDLILHIDFINAFV